MTQEEKSKIYSSLLFEHDKLSNEINSIKSESIDLNQSQIDRINKIQVKIGHVVNEMRKMMS